MDDVPVETIPVVGLVVDCAGWRYVDWDACELSVHLFSVLED